MQQHRGWVNPSAKEHRWDFTELYNYCPHIRGATDADMVLGKGGAFELKLMIERHDNILFCERKGWNEEISMAQIWLLESLMKNSRKQQAYLWIDKSPNEIYFERINDIKYDTDDSNGKYICKPHYNKLIVMSLVEAYRKLDAIYLQMESGQW